MNLIQQVQGVVYSFVFGMVFTFIYYLINSCFFTTKQLFRYFFSVVIGIMFGSAYYLGLLIINEGIIRFYFIVAIVCGYVIYQNYYSDKMMIVIIKLKRTIKRLLKPIVFICRKINVIIMFTRRKIKWQKKESKKHS